MKFFVRIAGNALALWVCVQLLAGVHLTNVDSTLNPILYYLLAGAVLAVLNALVRPLVVLLSLPFYVVTLGLFFLIVNAVILMIASQITTSLGVGITFDTFGWALGAGIVVSIVNALVEAVAPQR
ncbi:phage holin family protein [Arcanobacterium haemolyticum]|nr:phage holin family protein [Arcanobacterium haemolyticum]